MSNTMSDLFTLLCVLLTGILFGIAGGFLLGQRYEKILWKGLIPSQLEETCKQCQETGAYKGFKKGKEAGLKSCDDVIDNINNGGRR